MKNIVSIVIAVVCVAALVFLAYRFAPTPEETQNPMPPEESQTQTPPEAESNLPAEENVIQESEIQGELSTEAPAEEPQSTGKSVIGKSVQSRDITAYHFGGGSEEILFVGGIHGGYAWNTARLAYQLIDYLTAHPEEIPANAKITIIPVLNPDGLAKVVDKTGMFNAADVSTSADTAAARFNANNVDLNRNFDCEWQAKAVWQNKTVSAGSAAFSEPESAAIRDYAQSHSIAGVVAWYGFGGGVYVSSCDSKMLPESEIIMNLYSRLSGYAPNQDFSAYAISGDMTDWFSKNNVPAIGVLLTAANDTEWDKNWAGSKEIIKHFAQ